MTPTPVRMKLSLVLAATLLATPAFGQGRKQGQQPKMTPPSITEYKPRSTLVVPAHSVPRAKYPAIDFHVHASGLNSKAAYDKLIALMDTIGMGAIVMDGAVIGEEAIIGAGALVMAGTQVPPRTLWAGSPARERRTLAAEEIAHLAESAAHYVALKNDYLRK